MKFGFHTLFLHVALDLRNGLQALLLISGMVFCHLPFFAQSYNIDDVNGETIYLSSSSDGYVLLYDSGGPFGNYQDFEDYEVTICSNFYLAGCPPPPIINCTFNYIDIEPESGCGFDWLQMDNGPFYCNENYPPLYGTTAVSYISNTEGCINVRFHSDLSLTYEGFELLFEADHPNQYDPNPLQCNDQRQGEVYWTIHGCPSCIDYHTCGGDEYGPYWGSEIQYDIDAEGPVTLTVDGDVDFFVYGYATNVGPNGCPPISSIACATGNQQSVSFDASDYPYGIWVIVDGEVANFDISLECNPCDPDPVDCGQVIHDFLSDGTDSHTVYDCVGPDYPFLEHVYAFTPEASGFYTLVTYGYATAAPAIIVSDCCGGGGIPMLVETTCDLCEHSWFPNSTINRLEVFLQGGNTYYIFIEQALNPNIDEFQFWIDCHDPLDCDPAPPLECGDLVTGDNTFSSGVINRVVDYCNNAYSYWTGGERVYSFHADFTGSVSVFLFGLNADLDLFALDECDAGSCLYSSTNSSNQDEAFTMEVVEGHTYYLVIDGYLGAASTYSLSLDCEAAKCADCGDCFTYTIWNKGLTSEVTCIPKYIDCSVADYPTDDHTFQWTVDGVVKSTKYKPTLSLQTGRKAKVCQIVKYLGIEEYRCCWDIEPSPGCAPPPVAHMVMEGQWPLDQVTLNASTSANGKKYFWDFGDGTTLVNGGNISAINHTYSFGSYTYCTYVQNEYGISTYCKTFAPGAFECAASSNPQFTYSLTGRSLLIRDVNMSGAIISAYTIDFGDSTAIVQGGSWTNRSHTFEKDSVYEVCIRFTTTHQEGGFTCNLEGCVCFSVKVGCCQQTIDNCYDLKPTYLSSNGGLQYKFEYTTPGVQVLQWEVDGNLIPNSTENNITYLFPQSGFYRVCCLYKDQATGCFIKCCKWIYVGDPFDPNECGSILYQFDEASNGFRYVLNASASDVDEVQWSVDAPVSQSLGAGLQSDLLSVPAGTCQEYVISVRYFDKTCNCYRLCCLRFYLCAPSACASVIRSRDLGNGKTKFYADDVYEQMKWYKGQTLLGSGDTLVYALQGSGERICLYYYDPVSKCHRVCCRDVATATNQIEGLVGVEVTPNPAGDQVTVELSFATPRSVGLELVNELGMVVRRVPAGNLGYISFMHRMELGDLPAGMYLVRVYTDQGSLVRRIIHL